MSTPPTKPSNIARIGLAAALLMPLGMSGISAADDTLKKDVAAAVTMLSTTAESQSNRVMKAFALVKRHDNAQALAQLIGWLDAAKATERRSAVYMIQMLPWKDPSPAWPDLRELLSHSEGVTRGMAAMTLASTGDAQSYAKVVALMKDDKDPYVRRCAAWAVGEFGDLKGLEDLKAALTDENPLVKANAQNAIDRLTFLRDHANASGDVAKIVRGVWLISGSVMFQEQRIDRAVAMIRSANEPTRSEMLEKLKKGNSQAIRHSASLASQRLASPE
jgi:HEAT repeat protein